MVFRPLDGIGNHRPCFHDEGPVAGLGKEQFPGGLAQGPIAKGMRRPVPETLRQFNHPDRRNMKVGVDPRIGAFQPDRPVAFIAPRGGAGGTDLVRVVPCEEFRGGDHRKGFLVVGRFAKKVVEEDRAFIPPVSVKFGIVRAKDDRLDAHDTAQVFNLLFPVEHEVGGVIRGPLSGQFGPVWLLVGGPASDAVVFQSGEFPHPIGLDVGADVVVLEIESAVAVEIPVFPVAGIALLGTPHLFTGFDVSAEGGRTRRGEDGGKDTVGRAGFGINQAVGVDDEPSDFGPLQMILQSGIVGALRQPDAPWVPSKAVPVIVSGDLNLGANRLREFPHQGKESMGRSTGDDFQYARVLKLSKCGYQVPMVAVTKKMTAVVQTVVIKARESVEGGVLFCPVQLFACQFELFFESVDITILKKGVAQHRAERGGHRHGEPEVDPVADESFHHVEKGKIGFRDGLIQPVFLEEFRIFRMADKRKMGVKDGGDVSLDHRRGFRD